MTPLTAIATPRRREILRLTWRDELSAGQIHQALPDVTFGAVSQHLAVLQNAGLLQLRREGRRRFYRARPEALGPLRAWLEATWDDALYRLKVQAELEEARRGPRSSTRPAPRHRHPPAGPQRKGETAA